MLMPPTVTSASYLLAHSDADGADVAIGCTGLSVTTMMMVWLARLLDPRDGGGFAARAVPISQLLRNSAGPTSTLVTDDEQFCTPSTLSQRLKHFWLSVTTPCCEWLDRRSSSAHKSQHFVGCFGMLFESFVPRRHWWLLVETVASVFVSVIAGVVESGRVGCSAMEWIVFAVSMLLAAVGVWLRPMNALLDDIVMKVLLAAQAATSLSTAVGGHAAANAIAFATSVIGLLQALLIVLLVLRVRCGCSARSLVHQRRWKHHQQREGLPTDDATPHKSLLLLFSDQPPLHLLNDTPPRDVPLSLRQTAALRALIVLICK
jgi:hypothetical protein